MFEEKQEDGLVCGLKLLATFLTNEMDAQLKRLKKEWLYATGLTAQAIKKSGEDLETLILQQASASIAACVDVDENWWTHCWADFKWDQVDEIVSWILSCEQALLVCECGCNKIIWPFGWSMPGNSSDDIGSPAYFYSIDCIAKDKKSARYFWNIPYKEL